MSDLPLHFRSTDILRECVRMLRRFVDATTVSLYLPPSSGGVREPLLIHEGDDPPVAELTDLAAAVDFSNRHHGEQDDFRIDPNKFLQKIDSSSSGGFLVRVRPPGSTLGLNPAEHSEPQPTRRTSDFEDGVSEDQPGIWIGLRMKDAGQGRLQALLQDRASSREFGRWRDWIIALGAALALHAQQVSAMIDDPVSGVPGRVRFEGLLAQAVEQAVARKRPFSLLLVNPDDFDVVNEHFDRKAGDAVIREIAGRLTGLVRTTDAVHRYGGAIFPVLLPDTSLDDATCVAENLRSRLTEGAYLQGAARLGFSIGLAAFEPTEFDDTRKAGMELFRRADQALHEAKKTGGGRAIVWGANEGREETGSIDRLSGIFTADLAKDYRNMLLLWDSVGIISANPDPDDLAVQTVERLKAAFKPERVALLLFDDDNTLCPVAVRTSNSAPGAPKDTLDLSRAQQRLLKKALSATQPVEWTEKSKDHGEPVVSWAVPLASHGTRLGCLYLDGGRVAMTLEPSDLLFLKALSDQLAAALNHARLAAQDRSRQSEQRSLLRAELSDLRRALGQARLVSRSAEMDSVLTMVRRVAPTEATVLITGESGTGKELLTRTIHEMSDRKDKPFVVVDCGAIAATLIDSELFGHKKGAYTGAQESARGRLAEANRGTVMLDEIGELPLEVQSKLLRFVQEKQITSVGGTRSVEVDVRLVAVTNRDLRSEVEAGRFREDLYHRLNVVTIESPALRQRPDDILHLAEHFLNLYAVQYQKGIRRFSKEAESGMLAYRWPGNVRELQNRVMKAVILSEGGAIDLESLGIDMATDPPPPVPESPRPTPTAGAWTGFIDPEDASLPTMPAGSGGSSPRSAESARAALADGLEKQVKRAATSGARGAAPLGRWLDEDLVLEAWNATGGMHSRGARMLGIPETTFRRKISRVLNDVETGLSLRSPEWDTVRPLIADLLRTDLTAGENRLENARLDLLTIVAERIPNLPSLTASLMGVTTTTYRSWLAKHGLDQTP